jgi:hypothetical protein
MYFETARSPTGNTLVTHAYHDGDSDVFTTARNAIHHRLRIKLFGLPVRFRVVIASASRTGNACAARSRPR